MDGAQDFYCFPLLLLEPPGVGRRRRRYLTALLIAVNPRSLRQLYQLRAMALQEYQVAGKSLALLPHMILTREKEGMPFDGATAGYRAACEGNVELLRWLIGYGADRSLRDAEGNEVPLPEDTPNAEEIEEALQMHD